MVGFIQDSMYVCMIFIFYSSVLPLLTFLYFLDGFGILLLFRYCLLIMFLSVIALRITTCVIFHSLFKINIALNIMLTLHIKFRNLTSMEVPLLFS